MSGRLELGRRGEDAATARYEALGFVVERNWRTRRGEIDLVCTRAGLVVFVEVKTRSSSRFGSGVEAVDRRKQQRIHGLAAEWLAQQSQRFAELRFDVVDVDARGNLQVFENCF